MCWRGLTSLHVIGILDEDDQPTGWHGPPSGTAIEAATASDICLFQDTYGLGWMLRYGVRL